MKKKKLKIMKMKINQKIMKKLKIKKMKMKMKINQKIMK